MNLASYQLLHGANHTLLLGLLAAKPFSGGTHVAVHTDDLADEMAFRSVARTHLTHLAFEVLNLHPTLDADALGALDPLR